jgi:conjugal transfer pilin signal peptidase TrbI
MSRDKKVTIIIFTLIGVYLVASHWFQLEVNTSSSLPHYLYLVQKDQLPTKGQYVMFKHYLFPDPLIKRVEGVEGNSITIKDCNVYIDDRHIAPLVDKNSKGEPLNPIQEKIVPLKHYFVAGDHRKSFDSCYQTFGLVHQSEVKGRAWPIF